MLFSRSFFNACDRSTSCRILPFNAVVVNCLKVGLNADEPAGQTGHVHLLYEISDCVNKPGCSQNAEVDKIFLPALRFEYSSSLLSIQHVSMVSFSACLKHSAILNDRSYSGHTATWQASAFLRDLCWSPV